MTYHIIIASDFVPFNETQVKKINGYCMIGIIILIIIVLISISFYSLVVSPLINLIIKRIEKYNYKEIDQDDINSVKKLVDSITLVEKELLLNNQLVDFKNNRNILSYYWLRIRYL